jgi:hypothetical protein
VRAQHIGNMVARRRLGKHAPAATDMHITMDELLDAVFSMSPRRAAEACIDSVSCVYLA